MSEYSRSPIHGIVRSSHACQWCGVRAWKWIPVQSEPTAKILVCIGCDHTPLGEHIPLDVHVARRSERGPRDVRGALEQVFHEVNLIHCESERDLSLLWKVKVSIQTVLHNLAFPEGGGGPETS